MENKIMLLGGNKYLLPYVKKAHELNFKVVTCDYLPDNVAHKYSDIYRNVSIIDKDSVLESAERLDIKGILSPATDPGVVSAAYVADKLGLNSVPYESAVILQDKSLFRKFLVENGFNAPKSYTCESYEQLCERFETVGFPAIVKPVDSAGSKGVSKVVNYRELGKAFELASEYSICGKVIVEEFIEKAYETSGSDSFSINNELVFFSLDSQLFDESAENEFTPVAHVWPTMMPDDLQKQVREDVQRIIKILNLGTSIYNIEVRVGKNGKPYIMEMAPRAGGNRIAEVLDLAYKQNLIENSIRNAVGMDLLPMAEVELDCVWAEYVLHSNVSGILEQLEIVPWFKEKHVVDEDIWYQVGEKVDSFTGANKSLGTVFLKFDDMDQALKMLRNTNEWLNLKVRREVEEHE